MRKRTRSSTEDRWPESEWAREARVDNLLDRAAHWAVEVLPPGSVTGERAAMLAVREEAVFEEAERFVREGPQSSIGAVKAALGRWRAAVEDTLTAAHVAAQQEETHGDR